MQSLLHSEHLSGLMREPFLNAVLTELLAFDFKELFSLYFLDLFLLSSLPLSEVLYSLLCLLYLSPFFS
ncbi:hypothetical protein CUBM_gp148c [Staphylococcus phage CUB-M]|nr:hypothetical protein CUBM_gp148c [Staphylococcus phage CUB-M]